MTASLASSSTKVRMLMSQMRSAQALESGISRMCWLDAELAEIAQ
jgi:hypothetical protein